MKKNIRMVFAFIAIAALATTFILQYASRARMAYVDVNKIYNDFGMKKELEQKLTTVQTLRKQQLDSLELNLNILSRSLQAMETSPNKALFQEKGMEFETKRQEYLQKQKTFSENNDAMTQQYTEQIWKQINQYVKDYGKEHKYTYILGADGTGAVMYAEDKSDITAEVSGYVNERYKGKGATQ